MLQQLKDNLAGTTAIVKQFFLSVEQFCERRDTDAALLLWQCYQEMTNHRGSPEDFIGKWFPKVANLGLANGVGKDDLLRVSGLLEKIKAVKQRVAAHKLAPPPPLSEMPKLSGVRRYGDFLVVGGCVDLSPEDDYRRALLLLKEQPGVQIAEMRSFMSKMQNEPSVDVLKGVRA
jgi:hypothetical protein